jgi:hypothetical protein
MPQFTLKLVKHYFDSPATSSTNDFTGQQTTIPGNHFEWTTLDITITNQKFDGNTSEDYGYDSHTGMMYSIRFKGHFSQDWNILYKVNCGDPYFDQKGGTDTTISLLIDGGWVNADDISRFAPDSRPDGGVALPSEGQADFQVNAMSGTAFVNHAIPLSPWKFIGLESGWSDIHTLNISDGTETMIQNTSVTPSPSPTPAPTLPEQNPTEAAIPIQPNTQADVGIEWQQNAVLGFVVLVAVLFVAALLVRNKKQNSKTVFNQ